MRLAIAVVAAAAVSTVATPPAAAQQRPVVQVSFVVAERTFQDEYTAPELRSIQRAGAKLIARHLEQGISFVRFDTAAVGEHRLVFELARKDPDSTATGPDEVGLHGRLEGAGVPQNRLYWFRFRELEQFHARKGLPAELVRELQTKLAGAQPEPVGRELLSLVPIARTATVWAQPLGWVLPFKHADLCLDIGSTLRVRSRVPSGGGPLRADFDGDASGTFDPNPLPAALRDRRHHILSAVFPSQQHVDALRRAAAGSGVEVEAIFVREYRRSSLDCATPISPEDAFPAPGGGL